MLAATAFLLASLAPQDAEPRLSAVIQSPLERELRAYADERVDASDLFARLAAVTDGAPPRTPARLLEVLREPWSLRARGAEIASHLDSRTFDRLVLGDGVKDDPDELARWWASSGAHLLALAPPWPERLAAADFDTWPFERVLAEPTVDGMLERIEDHLAALHAEIDEAFAGLDDGERGHLVAHWSDVGARFEEHIYLDRDPDEERLARNRRTLDLAARVDLERLVGAAMHATRGNWAAVGGALRERCAAEGRDLAAPVVAERATPFGRIVVAGTGDGVHTKHDVAVLIELGGDDRYRGAPASTLDAEGRPTRGVAIVCDLAGDDAYESTAAGSIAFGGLGVGMLIDVAGADSYVGLRWTQGAAFLGVGLLVDTAGDDVYRAQTFAQGTACFGYAALGDYAGHDRYEAHRYAQGVGLAGGAGALHERSGDDSYYCKGTWPSSYGTDGVFEGWGQGVGIGFRRMTGGGVGVLTDCAGDDRYEAGNFSQGGGYAYGLGCLRDDGDGDDVYIGSRYAQGFSAHQAAGWFRDEGGNDRYETRFAVHAGLAWDQSISWFEDVAGDDRYRGGGFSLGASAHNGFAVFLDRGGSDAYLDDGLARSGPNDYHGGSSLSLFCDEGGGADVYVDATRDGAERTDGPSLFRDR